MRKEESHSIAAMKGSAEAQIGEENVVGFGKKPSNRGEEQAAAHAPAPAVSLFEPMPALAVCSYCYNSWLRPTDWR